MAKAIVLSRHAIDAVELRDLDVAWIADTTLTPDWIEPDPADATVDRRFRSISAFRGRIMRVACRESAASIFVISCFFDRRARPPQ